jgi:hypothetical protein
MTLAWASECYSSKYRQRKGKATNLVENKSRQARTTKKTESKRRVITKEKLDEVDSRPYHCRRNRLDTLCRIPGFKVSDSIFKFIVFP